MTVDVVKNMGASVRPRLLNHAKASGEPLAEVLQYAEMQKDDKENAPSRNLRRPQRVCVALP